MSSTPSNSGHWLGSSKNQVTSTLLICNQKSTNTNILIKLRLDLGILELVIASKMNLESDPDSPKFAENQL